MNAFEKARLKYEKNRQRQGRGEVVVEPVVEPVVQPVVQPVVEAPKEKTEDAVIEVVVRIPAGTYAFRLVKANVARNVQFPQKITGNEFKNRLKEGLRPLLGEVAEHEFNYRDWASNAVERDHPGGHGRPDDPL